MEPGLEATRFYDPYLGTASNATHLAVVEVDPSTCAVRVLRYVVVEDCGRIINPLIVEGQAIGGVVQGIGAALLEELVYAADGQLLTATLMDYLVPTAGDVPAVEGHHLGGAPPATLGGLKGGGGGGCPGRGPPGAEGGAAFRAFPRPPRRGRRQAPEGRHRPLLGDADRFPKTLLVDLQQPSAQRGFGESRVLGQLLGGEAPVGEQHHGHGVEVRPFFTAGLGVVSLLAVAKAPRRRLERGEHPRHAGADDTGHLDLELRDLALALEPLDEGDAGGGRGSVGQLGDARPILL